MRESARRAWDWTSGSKSASGIIAKFRARPIFDKMVSVGMYRHVGIAKVRLEILDVEDIRPHCPMTLPHCVRRLEAAREEAIAAAGEDRYWIWRSYMPAWLAPGPRPAKVYQARLRRLPQRG